MGRLIDADAFDERVRLDVGLCEEELTEDFKDGISTILEMMKTAPTVDAVPVKHGRWIDEKTNYSCSECHRGCWVNSNYCPWCGVKMNGKEGEQHV